MTLIGDGIADDTAAINALLAAGPRRVALPEPPVAYRTTAPLLVTRAGTRVVGDGRKLTVIRSEAAGPAIEVAAGVEYPEFEDFSITRAPGMAAPGDDGIRFAGWTNLAKIENVEISRCWRGLSLGPTGYSYVHNVLVDNCYDDGVFVQGTAQTGTTQWSISKTLAQRCNGWGFRFQSPAGFSGSCSMGDLVALSTWANKLGGIGFFGSSSARIQAVRMIAGFFGSDGGHAVYLDTFGSSTHSLIGTKTETAGLNPCGVDLSTPAPMVGSGFRMTENNTAIQAEAIGAIANSHSGLWSKAPRLQVVGANMRLNGYAGLAGQRRGIHIEAGMASVVGSSAKGHAEHGVYSAVDTVVIDGNDLRENALPGFAAGVPLVNSKIGVNWV